MKEYKYLFSVIVPIYNVEKYLEESIESVVNQTIGFENIQLILINDGSTDSSEEICLKYKNKYPDNVVYEKKENGGVSSARNTGYKYIEGKYVRFLDPDDLILSALFEKIYNFFEINYNRCNLIKTTTIGFNDGEMLIPSELPKDKGYKMIDIINSYEEDVLPNLTAAFFFKQDLILKYYFDEKLKIGEDHRIMDTILSNEKNYIFLDTIGYLARVKRKNSLTNSLHIYSTKEFLHTTFLSEICNHYININFKIYGKVLEITQIQCLIMIGRLFELIQIPIEKYKSNVLSNIKEVLSFISDELIIERIGRLSSVSVEFFLGLKYRSDDDMGKDLFFHMKKEILINTENIVINKIVDKNSLLINFLVEKRMSSKINKLYFKIDENYFLASIINIKRIRPLWGIHFQENYLFSIELEEEKFKNKDIEIYLDIDGLIEQYHSVININ